MDSSNFPQKYNFLAIYGPLSSFLKQKGNSFLSYKTDLSLSLLQRKEACDYEYFKTKGGKF